MTDETDIIKALENLNDAREARDAAVSAFKQAMDAWARAIRENEDRIEAEAKLKEPDQ